MATKLGGGGGGGQSSFTPTKRGGGEAEIVAMLKGKGNNILR